MIRLYIVIAFLAIVLFAVLKWRGASMGKSVGFSALLFLVLAVLVTFLFWWGGDKPTSGAQTIRQEDLQR